MTAADNPDWDAKLRAARARNVQRLRNAGLRNAADVIEARANGDEPREIGDAQAGESGGEDGGSGF
ncbi:hypothetical protein CKO28_18880 [Rhodovibrio sodomensis]|uniref:DUF3606 domain-containing protein n=1 Tax=Rhodovibrio sodomensis TaxID=1088 RepID=A0ABS1DI29_9PROT|nr:hypothetical protein [Rhodovibrio sodomensis]MBK1670104.1 hypothetical protein [Rhodovibrio sodomensis]